MPTAPVRKLVNRLTGVRKDQGTYHVQESTTKRGINKKFLHSLTISGYVLSYKIGLIHATKEWKLYR